jgi:hypothetical protein
MNSTQLVIVAACHLHCTHPTRQSPLRAKYVCVPTSFFHGARDSPNTIVLNSERGSSQVNHSIRKMALTPCTIISFSELHQLRALAVRPRGMRVVLRVHSEGRRVNPERRPLHDGMIPTGSKVSSTVPTVGRRWISTGVVQLEKRAYIVISI